MRVDTKNKKPVCPLCGSRRIIPVIHEFPSPELEEEARKGKVALGGSMDWEGQPEWHCKKCDCEWRGKSTVFKGWKMRKGNRGQA
jgi:hypothetical protein